jgi:hypothetical protein
MTCSYWEGKLLKLPDAPSLYEFAYMAAAAC